jgi:hypothetical protein
MGYVTEEKNTERRDRNGVLVKVVICGSHLAAELALEAG